MGQHLFILSLTLIIAFFSGTAFSYAQEEGPPLAEIPDEYIEEAQNYFERCEADSNVSGFYDCRCMAGNFLNERIERGPDYSGSAIELELGSGCLDAALIAGKTYGECLAKGPLLPLNQSIEEYCTCYANTFGRIFKASGLELTSKNKVRLRIQAGTICENPARGRKLYPLAYSLSGIEEEKPQN